MQPLKLTIPGRFWDSQLYKGTLHLFDLEGALRQIDWNRLVGGLVVPERCRLALECAFLRSDFLYGDRWDRLYRDQEIKDLIGSKFADLLQVELRLSAQQLENFTVHRTDSPFPYAHNDSLFYKDQLYACSQSGVFTQFLAVGAPNAGEAEKMWDAPVSSLDASLDVLAIAAGDQGLFRAPVAPYFREWIGAGDGPRSASEQICNDCSYVASNILSFGYDSGAKLVAFDRPSFDRDRDEADMAKAYWLSRSIGAIEGDQLFPEGTRGGFVWGSRERMCMARNGSLHVLKYSRPGGRNRIGSVQDLRRIQLQPWKGSPVSGDNAVFGSILELDNCLVVVRSDDAVETIPGEPTNWRVFPKSKHYINQLHVIYEDRIEILSYNHDYFIDQSAKAFGDRHVESKF